MIQKLITKYENLSKALEGFDTKKLVDNFLADLQKLKLKNSKLPITHVSGSLPDKFADIIRFIESDLMEVKLYGNDGFDNQEELDGKDYLVKLIKEAVGNDR